MARPNLITSADFLGLNNQSFVVPAGSPALAGDTFTTNNRGVQMFMVGAN